MELMMFIGDDCIESIPLNHNFICIPGHIRHAVRMLRTKHHQLILQLNTEPEFLLHGIKQSQQISNLSDGYLKMNAPTELKEAV